MKICISILSLLLLTGCGFIRSKDGVDQAQIERIIYGAAKESIILAINKAHENDDLSVKLIAAAKLVTNIEDNAMPLLANPEIKVDTVLETMLLNLVPEEYQGLMMVAYETFNLYYEFQQGIPNLPEPHLSYLRAFLSGIRDGTKSILTTNEAHIDVRYNLHITEES